MLRQYCYTHRMDVTIEGLTRIGHQLIAARGTFEDMWDTARQAAIEAAAHGTPETKIADALTVDRTTVRKWLGK